MKTKLYTKTLQNIVSILAPLSFGEGLGVRIFFLLSFSWAGAGYAQLINAPADCPIAYRLCDAQASYHFQLVDAGLIDDAHGSLSIGSLDKSNVNLYESRSAFLSFTPNYSGQFGLKICPDQNIEKLNFALYINPNCVNLGPQEIVAQGTADINEPTLGCTGIGQDPLDQFNPDFVSPFITIQAGVPYMLFVRTAWITIPGNHRLTLTFQGDVVTTHPDLFDNVACAAMATNDVVEKTSTINVFPNPFNEKVTIASNVLLQKTELYNLLGERVFAQDFSNEIDTGFLQAGVYILKLYGEDNAVFVRKIVKK